MADLRIMRRKLQEQIEVLQARLHALELVEQTVREMDGKEGKVRPARHTRAHRNGTVMDTCRQIILESPNRQWTAADMLTAVEQRGSSDANRENVSTTMRRLAKAGILERTSGSRRTGYTYRVVTSSNGG